MTVFRNYHMAEARQFVGNNCIELLYWMCVPGVDDCLELHTTDHPIIHGPKEEVTEIGDWIVKDIKGEFHLMKPAEFEHLSITFRSQT